MLTRAVRPAGEGCGSLQGTSKGSPPPSGSGPHPNGNVILHYL